MSVGVLSVEIDLLFYRNNTLYPLKLSLLRYQGPVRKRPTASAFFQKTAENKRVAGGWRPHSRLSCHMLPGL